MSNLNTKIPDKITAHVNLSCVCTCNEYAPVYYSIGVCMCVCVFSIVHVYNGV